MEDLKSAGSTFATKYQGRTIYESRYQCSASKGSFHGFLFIVRQWKGKIQVEYSCLKKITLKHISGSVYKLIWPHFTSFMVAYFALDLLHRFVLTEDASQKFEMFCVFCQRFRKSIPVTFLTGFYVSQVVSRYWNKFAVLPYPDKIAMKIVTHISGTVSDRFIFDEILVIF